MIPENLRLSRHAIEQMAARRVDVEDLACVFTHPVGTEPHDGRTRWVGRNGVVAVVAPDGVIVSVIWRRAERWTSAQMAARAA